MIEDFSSPVPITWWKVSPNTSPRFVEFVRTHQGTLNFHVYVVQILPMSSGAAGTLGLSLTVRIRQRIHDLLELVEAKTGHIHGVIEEINLAESFTGSEPYSIRFGIMFSPKKLEPQFISFGHPVAAEECTLEECRNYHLPYWTPEVPVIHRPTRFEREDVL